MRRRARRKSDRINSEFLLHSSLSALISSRLKSGMSAITRPHTWLSSRKAAENLGANTTQYWLRVALPILLPSILGAMILLFGNAFGAYATAYALTGGRLPIITIQIGAQVRGDVLHNPNLGNAMAMGMVFIMAISLASYSWLQGKTERWLR